MWIGLQINAKWTNPTCTSTFRNWGQGEPFGDGQCVLMKWDGDWSDFACSRRYKCLCEQNVVPILQTDLATINLSLTEQIGQLASQYADTADAISGLATTVNKLTTRLDTITTLAPSPPPPSPPTRPCDSSRSARTPVSRTVWCRTSSGCPACVSCRC